jgi:hypothetical protein
MELLVYARNHVLGGVPCGALGGGSGPGRSSALPGRRTFVGIAVGVAPQVEALEDQLPTSFIEVRIGADAPDPVTEIALLVAKALAAEALPSRGGLLEFSCARGRVRLWPEPGFDTPRTICRALMPVLEKCRVQRGLLTNTTAIAS